MCGNSFYKTGNLCFETSLHRIFCSRGMGSLLLCQHTYFQACLFWTGVSARIIICFRKLKWIRMLQKYSLLKVGRGEQKKIQPSNIKNVSLPSYNELMGSNHPKNNLVFTNYIHEVFSVWAVETDNKILICPKQFFFLSLPVEKEIIITIH